MPKARISSTAGKSINQRNPLGKNLACTSCKTRRVRCDGVAPSCGACLRSARHEGRDPASCGCTYASSKTAKVDDRRRTRRRRSESVDTQSDEEDDLDLTFRRDMDAYLDSWTSVESTQFPFPLPSERRFSSTSLSSSSGSCSSPSTTPSTSPAVSLVPLPLPSIPLPPPPSSSLFTTAPSSARLRFTPLIPPPPLPILPFLLHSSSNPTSSTFPLATPSPPLFPSPDPATLFSTFVLAHTPRGITIPVAAVTNQEAEDWLASCIDLESPFDPSETQAPMVELPLWDIGQLVFPDDGERLGGFEGEGWRDEMTALDELEMMLCKDVLETTMSWVGGVEC